MLVLFHHALFTRFIFVYILEVLHFEKDNNFLLWSHAENSLRPFLRDSILYIYPLRVHIQIHLFLLFPTVLGGLSHSFHIIMLAEDRC